jgi:cytochrome b561
MAHPATNDEHRYGWIAIVLHWCMAALLLALLILGIAMVDFPDVGYDQRKITLILVHKALGMAALAAALVRLLWRLANRLPRFVGGLPEWQQASAVFVHLWLYALMLALPVTGWLMSSAGGYPTPIFSWFNMPDLMRPNEHLFRTLIDVHRWLGYGLAGLVGLHAAAALRHHLVQKDDTLRKILPGG